MNFSKRIVIIGIFLALPISGIAQPVDPTAPGFATTPRTRRAENEPSNPKLPSLYLIGDSTVRNGQGTGTGGQWGWGDEIAPFFNTNALNVVNRALGGTSSRTYYRDQWPRIRELLKAGDFVIMQFGHNDRSPVNDASRARGTIKGVGDESEEIDNLITKKHEVVHSFGWYEKQFIQEARVKGAVPMVCSLIPRNSWKDGKAARDASNYAGWARQAASEQKAPFIDINEIIARQYDQLGQEKVKELFVVGAGPHTSLAGAQTNALCVVAGLKTLKDNPLLPFLSDKGQQVAPVDAGTPKKDAGQTP